MRCTRYPIPGTTGTSTTTTTITAVDYNYYSYYYHQRLSSTSHPAQAHLSSSGAWEVTRPLASSATGIDICATTSKPSGAAYQTIAWLYHTIPPTYHPTPSELQLGTCLWSVKYPRRAHSFLPSSIAIANWNGTPQYLGF